MITVKQTDTTLELTNRVSPGLRALIFIIGLVPLLAPYELLYKVRWQSYTHPAFLFVLLIVLGALAVSGFFFFFALMAYSRRLYFDRHSQEMTYGFSHTLQPYREHRYDFVDLSSIEVDEHDWSDGPASYSLLMHTHAGSKISIGYFEDRKEADRYQGLIKEWTAIR